MTRKDYKAIAAAINGALIIKAPHCCANEHEYMRAAREQSQNIVRNIATALYADNARFDLAKFLEATGVQY